ncbi:hypothetical protein CWC22_021600 [Pseudoalteromonas rubra]|uniref:Uncharacterized protein n=1 Tax=Pseudoalteromonas rubra TaxID=43658 RepID=A0A5S3USR5_9GAMM|nr:hypothetical protein CWC22_021600 [Pseudoalteromonas rubra]
MRFYRFQGGRSASIRRASYELIGGCAELHNIGADKDYLAILLIRFYQRFLSPYKGFRCAHAVVH